MFCHKHHYKAWQYILCHTSRSLAHESNIYTSRWLHFISVPIGVVSESVLGVAGCCAAVSSTWKPCSPALSLNPQKSKAELINFQYKSGNLPWRHPLVCEKPFWSLNFKTCHQLGVGEHNSVEPYLNSWGAGPVKYYVFVIWAIHMSHMPEICRLGTPWYDLTYVV